MLDKIKRDYEFYTKQLAKQQAESDAINAAFGWPREDLAWARAQQRHRERSMPTFDDMKRQFKSDRALRDYAAAIRG